MRHEQKQVCLPTHLWAALDEMSRDSDQDSGGLVMQAVEHFVALQGYAVGEGRAAKGEAQSPALAVGSRAPAAAARPGPAHLPGRQGTEHDVKPEFGSVPR